ncbi:energy transducer TonB [Flavobacterium lacisediminis]|uniref:Energy transducer TonB n=1 Tax=Flavobacterium lacisediminis TaxID=2989705 RepID=A0ABT3EHW8_9FLAO|nr:energy transducer TonB [Flavobacterium lacisediminis]MCW1148185.1 energy transducer TonB [Flavobacterium lacisediminis]
MKKFLVLTVFVLFSNVCFSQIGGEDEVYLGGDFIDAKFQNGGVEKFYEYIVANFDTTTVEKKGQIIFEFTVNENGDVKNIKILRDLGADSAMELIRVLRKAPKWEPASRGGKPVSINLKMPLTFK